MKGGQPTHFCLCKVSEAIKLLNRYFSPIYSEKQYSLDVRWVLSSEVVAGTENLIADSIINSNTEITQFELKTEISPT